MTEKLKPDWAGKDLLSQFVNLLIQTKPIYWLMKQQARQVIIKTAERNGIPWRKNYSQLAASQAPQLLPETTNSTIRYPDYYLVPFHAYSQGNLCWEAAFEAESATYAMALRVWPKEPMTWQAAQDRLRGSFHRVLEEHGPKQVADILDIGCSIGLSTLTLHRYYKNHQNTPPRTVGLDLSPYMLAVAKTLDVNQEISEWMHEPAEKTSLPSQSFDLITLQFVTHELPHDATRAIFQEAFRLLRTGGYLALVDNNPQSPVIQNLPPVLFTLMKSTEPWSDEYYTLEMEAEIEAVGFKHKITVPSDPRHRTILAWKPH